MPGTKPSIASPGSSHEVPTGVLRGFWPDGAACLTPNRSCCPPATWAIPTHGAEPWPKCARTSRLRA